MEAKFPVVEAIQAIESRQDEVLRQLDELEKRVLKALADCGETLKKTVLPFAKPADAATNTSDTPSVPTVKAA